MVLPSQRSRSAWGKISAPFGGPVSFLADDYFALLSLGSLVSVSGQLPGPWFRRCRDAPRRIGLFYWCICRRNRPLRLCRYQQQTLTGVYGERGTDAINLRQGFIVFTRTPRYGVKRIAGAHNEDIAG